MHGTHYTNVYKWIILVSFLAMKRLMSSLLNEKRDTLSQCLVKLGNKILILKMKKKSNPNSPWCSYILPISLNELILDVWITLVSTFLKNRTNIILGLKIQTKHFVFVDKFCKDFLFKDKENWPVMRADSWIVHAFFATAKSAKSKQLHQRHGSEKNLAALHIFF